MKQVSFGTARDALRISSARSVTFTSMQSLRAYILTICILPTFVPIMLFGQIVTAPRDSLRANQTEEKFLEQSTEDAEQSQLLDELEKLSANPLDLNEATLEELTALPSIDAVLAKAILTRRNSVGRFHSFDELADIAGMDDERLEILETYAQIESAGESQSFFSTLHADYRGRVQQVAEEPEGFSTNTYQGTKPAMYNRLVLGQGENISAGILTQKDAGERSPADHVAGFIQAKNIGPVTSIVLGDYTIASGQGVMLWNAYGFSKGSEVITSPKRTGKTIRSFLSSDENAFLRGAAVESRFGSLSLTAFYSSHALDASLDSASGTITSLDASGLHRTTSELLRNNTVRERLIGGRIGTDVRTDKISANVHLTSYYSDFDKEIFSTSPGAFTGKKSAMIGFDYDVVFDRYNLFGEIARSHTEAFGGVAGLTAMLHKNIRATLLYRNFPSDFISVHGYAFGERNGATQNERGIYTGIQIKLTRTLKLFSYFDQFQFPDRTYTLPMPTSGNDFFIQTEWKPLPKALVTARYKREKKDDLVTAMIDSRENRSLVLRSQENIRLEYEQLLSRTTRLRLRSEYVDVTYENAIPSEHGYLFFADLRVRPTPSIECVGRISAFSTTSYDSRVYQFENDLQGVLTNIGLYGKGMRLYAVLKYTPFDRITLSGKYEMTLMDNVRIIGSGYDEIQGDSRSKFGIQLDARY